MKNINRSNPRIYPLAWWLFAFWFWRINGDGLLHIQALYSELFVSLDSRKSTKLRVEQPKISEFLSFYSYMTWSKLASHLPVLPVGLFTYACMPLSGYYVHNHDNQVDVLIWVNNKLILTRMWGVCFL